MDLRGRGLPLFFLMIILGHGQSEMIQTSGNVTVMEGEDAPLACRLTQHKDVTQMTWQKVLAGGGSEDIGAFSEAFDSQINDPFKNRVEFVVPGLEHSAIMVKNVTTDDEGLYRCVFHPFPEPSVSSDIWLTVNGSRTVTTAAPHNNATHPTAINSYSSPDESDYKDEHLAIIMLVNIACCLAIVGILGNGAVIWGLGFKMVKTINTVLFLNLAVANFLFTTFLLLSLIVTVATTGHWPFGKLNSSMIFLNMYVSVCVLVVISLDRFVSVRGPDCYRSIRNEFSIWKVICVSLGVWVPALVLNTPEFIFMYAQLYPHLELTVTRLLLGYLVPLATIIVSCCCTAIRRKRLLASHSGRPFKIIAPVSTAFFVCWAPCHIMALIVMTVKPEWGQVLDLLTMGLALLNSCINPLLYVFKGQESKCTPALSGLPKVLQNAFTEEDPQSNTGIL